jgi:hypothetical protein
MTAEDARLADDAAGKADWRNWGPYLSERAWGTVREDYSDDGTVWDAVPHDHARSRAYRWNEDGLAGISDRKQYLCFAIALWNGEDPILKERLFGLSGPEGNHGEDVKEYYYYLDATPTHSYLRMLYKYPQAEYPYGELVAENRRRGADEPEYELIDTGVFEESRYFDVDVSYAKADEDDVLIQIDVSNRGNEPAPLTVLPTLWFRNTWSWGYGSGPMGDVPGRPDLYVGEQVGGAATVVSEHPSSGRFFLYADGADEVIFTENETNGQRLSGRPLETPYVKDSFHRYIVGGEADAANPARHGTKSAAVYRLDLGPGEKRTIRLRLSAVPHASPFGDFDRLRSLRRAEADEFYDGLLNPDLGGEEHLVQRQALAGMIWSKQLYYYDVRQWLRGDPSGPVPPESRRWGRNRDWEHLNNFDIISMPDAWEYPWFAAWDLAFHAVPLALVDPEFAKGQLRLMTREWYMHANGQIPAYEWAFGDVNPPVHAWAARRVFEIDAESSGTKDTRFLKAVFHKLLLNFTWWVNMKDADGNNVFQGGFLGLDNISVFDRSAALPTGGHIDQSDGTAWMGFYTLEMLKIALELSKEDPVYQDLATKFFEHFLAIAAAMADVEGGHGLWDPEDGFYYDVLHLPDGASSQLKVRSLVGLMPLLAVDVAGRDRVEGLTAFTRRTRWFLENRPEMRAHLAVEEEPGSEGRYLVSILSRDRVVSLLRYMLDEAEFLSPHGIRSLSKVHEDGPYRLRFGGEVFEIDYEPAESTSGLFGGNSNWRGPVWFPINYLLIEALREIYGYYGDDLRVEMPTGSGVMMNLDEVADDLTQRLVGLFLPDGEGRRPAHGGVDRYRDDPHWRDLVLFYEYFDGDTGAGLGASHQTGWTGLVASLLQDQRGRPTPEKGSAHRASKAHAGELRQRPIQASPPRANP